MNPAGEHDLLADEGGTHLACGVGAPKIGQCVEIGRIARHDSPQTRNAPRRALRACA